MKQFFVILVIVAGVTFVLMRRNTVNQPGVTAGPVQVSPQQPSQKKSWTPEEIAKDPPGYLVWSDQQIQAQIAEREKRLNSLNQTRKDVVAKQSALTTKMEEVVNFRKRLQTAYQRAEDEDRWPVRMAGRTFERAKANEILAQTDEWLKDRDPLADAYEASLKKMDDSATALQDDLKNLGRLREKLALDLERVKLNQGMAELDQLRKTETQLASMSQALSQMSEEQAPVLPTAAKTSRVDIDSLMK